MKAEDLMTGDWVQIRHPKGLPDANGIQISEIDSSGHSICFFSNIAEGELTLSLDDIQPIPITPEILEKNFPSINGLAWWPQDDAFHCESRTNGDIMVSGQFRYVHQLQQALRLVGIEKEIVL